MTERGSRWIGFVVPTLRQKKGEGWGTLVSWLIWSGVPCNLNNNAG